MIETEKEIRIGEVHGWTKIRITVKGAGAPERTASAYGFPPDKHYEAPLPSYFYNLNAIQSAVLAQDEEFQKKFNRALVGITMGMTERKQCFFHQLTARDWAEAFIETLKGLGRL